MAPSRRTVLRTAGVLTAGAASGCSFGGCGRQAFFDLEPATDETLIEEYSDPVSVQSLGLRGNRIARAAIDEGNTTYDAGDRILGDGVYREGGAFYRLNTTAEGSRPAVGFPADFEVEFEPTGTPPGPAIAYEDLPTVDRQALMGTFLSEITRRIVGGGGRAGQSASGSGTLLYPENATGSSVLVPGSEYAAVTYERARVRLSVGDRTENGTLRTFRVESREVAPSREVFVRQAGERVVEEGVVLDGESLSQDQRDVLEAARGDDSDYEECIVEGASPAFRDVTATIFDIEWPDPNGHDEAFVRYDGTWYEAFFSQAQA